MIRVGDFVPGVVDYLSWREGLLWAYSNILLAPHAVVVTLPIVGKT